MSAVKVGTAQGKAAASEGEETGAVSEGEETRASHEEVEGFVARLREFHGSLGERRCWRPSSWARSREIPAGTP
jgi:hypothetical protein